LIKCRNVGGCAHNLHLTLPTAESHVPLSVQATLFTRGASLHPRRCVLDRNRGMRPIEHSPTGFQRNPAMSIIWPARYSI
jgi:hypothetical protein